MKLNEFNVENKINGDDVLETFDTSVGEIPCIPFEVFVLGVIPREKNDAASYIVDTGFPKTLQNVDEDNDIRGIVGYNRQVIPAKLLTSENLKTSFLEQLNQGKAETVSNADLKEGIEEAVLAGLINWATSNCVIKMDDNTYVVGEVNKEHLLLKSCETHGAISVLMPRRFVILKIVK